MRPYGELWIQNGHVRHLGAQRELLGGLGEAEQPEDPDTDPRDPGGHRVEPRQVSPVHREAREEDDRYDGGHEHRGGHDGVRGHHGSDFTVPHDEENASGLQMRKKTSNFETFLVSIWARICPVDEIHPWLSSVGFRKHGVKAISAQFQNKALEFEAPLILVVTGN